MKKACYKKRVGNASSSFVQRTGSIPGEKKGGVYMTLFCQRAKTGTIWIHPKEGRKLMGGGGGEENGE